MIISDPVSQFYDELVNASRNGTKGRIYIFSSPEIDSVAALNILEETLKIKEIKFSSVAVERISEIQNIFNSNKENIVVAIFVNCCGSINLKKLLKPSKSQKIFICSNKKPFNLKNVYNKENVNILVDQKCLKNLPSEEEIFSENEDPNDEMFEDWDNNRKSIKFHYKSIEETSQPSSLYFFKLLCKLGKESKTALWSTLVGITGMFTEDRINRKAFNQYMNYMRTYALNLDTRSAESSMDCISIKAAKSLNLCLYKHWTAYDSIVNTIEIAAIFKLFTDKGRDRLNEFLAKLGISLVESHQNFQVMDSKLRTIFDNIFQKHLPECGYNVDDFFVQSFNAVMNYGYAVSSLDFAHILLSIINNPILEQKNLDIQSRFSKCQSLITKYSVDDINSLVGHTIDLQTRITNTIQYLIDTSRVVKFGKNMYICSIEASYAHNHNLTNGYLYSLTITRKLMKAFSSCQRQRDPQELPFILILGLKQNPDEITEKLIVIGMPYNSLKNNGKNYFRQVFKQSAKDSQSHIEFPFIDQTIAVISSSDRGRFLNAVANFIS